MTTPAAIAERLAAGTHRQCGFCSAVVKIGLDGGLCRFCNRPIHDLRPKKTRAHRALQFGDPGGFADLPDGILTVAVLGKPITQGSMRAIAAGVMGHDKGDKLPAWRRAITTALYRATYGRGGWRPADCALVIDLVVTVPRKDHLPPGTVLFPDEHHSGDVDKYLRATQDALAPQPKKGAASSGEDRFRIVVDDSRIVDSHAVKTYPAPDNTHPWALPEPGIVLRLAAANTTVGALPRSCPTGTPVDSAITAVYTAAATATSPATARRR